VRHLQLSSLKHRCLAKCRASFSLLLLVTGGGPTEDKPGVTFEPSSDVGMGICSRSLRGFKNSCQMSASGGRRNRVPPALSSATCWFGSIDELAYSRAIPMSFPP
jgi:hypothetical protein